MARPNCMLILNKKYSKIFAKPIFVEVTALILRTPPHGSTQPHENNCKRNQAKFLYRRGR